MNMKLPFLVLLIVLLVIIGVTFTVIEVIKAQDKTSGNVTLLLVNSERNQYAAVKALLAQGADPNHVNPRGQNALMLACKTNGTLQIVSLLLAYGIDIHWQDPEGDNALHYAAEAGNLPVLQKLLAQGLQIDAGNQDNVTPLGYAAYHGQYGTVKYLLQHGADVNASAVGSKNQPIHWTATGPDGSSVIQLLLDHGADIESKAAGGVTPIYITFLNGFLNTTEQLYELGAELEVFNDFGEGVLHRAAHYGYVGHIRWLHGLDGGDLLRRLLNIQDDNGDTPLLEAAFANQLKAVRELLAFGAQNAIDQVNIEGENALMVVTANNGSLKIVELLIAHGINISQQDVEGRNAMHLAAMNGNVPVLQLLLDQGLDIDSTDEGNRTPLLYAVILGKYGTAKYLLQQIANVHIAAKDHKAQPIHYAIFQPDWELFVQLLLDYGADLEAQMEHGETPMYLTFSVGYLSRTKKLYELGAKVEVFREGGESVLHKAAQHAYIGHMRWLWDLEGGIILRRLLDHADDQGETALMTAVFENQFDAVKELLSYGADQSLKDNSGATALDLAKKNNYEDIVKLLSE